MDAFTKLDAKTASEWNVQWAIRDAQEAAYMNGDGYPSDKHLTDALAKHGLVIVEASKYDRMLTALQLIGSSVTEIQGIPTALEAISQAARNAIANGA